ncbi:MAG: SDR family NAD(P)-dependent oxidoreductase [Oligoflexia bacterium]|nr:SDR family NAD(P)-dependent oxidoreductase [Oligoflexia bacterium]
MKLQNQIILITGGGRGIGKTIGLACAREGAKVVLAARSKAQVEQAAADISKETGARVLGLACDVSNGAQIEALFSRIENELGTVTGLVCAAGIYGPIGPFETNSIEEWVHAVDVNLLGTARTVHRAISGMKARKGGHIVLFSGGGVAAFPNFSSYVTGKGGIWRFTETLGAELAPHGINVNCIAPGAVNTQFLEELLAAGPERVGKDFYEKSLRQKEEGGASPEKAAALAVYLLSDESTGLYGKNLSALWDDYRNIRDKAATSRSDLYTMRRVVTPEGGTRV